MLNKLERNKNKNVKKLEVQFSKIGDYYAKTSKYKTYYFIWLFRKRVILCYKRMFAVPYARYSARYTVKDVAVLH